jgi:CO/xanthine dehydrogenase Mo-binding subunit
MAEYEVIGKPRLLVDGHGKLTGAARYVRDLQLPGMLHARIVPSMYAHANIRHIDKSAALAVPGVVAVLTADDLPEIVPSSRKRLLLARGRVIFVGQPVALVLAVDEGVASDGAERVHVDYEPLPAALSIDEALAEDAPLVWPNGIPKGSSDAGAHGADSDEDDDDDDDELSGNIARQKSRSRGDVQRGFAEADLIMERTVTTPMVHQSSIETHGVIVQPDPVTGGAHVWTSTQGPFGVRHDIAEVLKVPDSDVHVTGMTVGGAFGGKFPIYEPLVALAARVVNRPVCLILTRMEELMATNPAPPVRIHVRAGAKRDGTLVALEGTVHMDSGCYPMKLADFLGIMLASFYPVPNFHVDTIEVLTFKQSVGAYRAPGAPTVIFAIDCLLDDMAKELGIDPIEIRLKNAARPGDLLADNKKWKGMGMAETLEALREHPAWKNRDQARAAGRGVGIAVGGWMGGTEPALAACSLNQDGLVHIHVGATDISGVATGFTLLAAEVFGVKPDQVRIISGNTDTAPYAGASAGSKVTYTTGAAVVKAAQAARQQVLEIAAEEFEAAVEDLEIVDGRVQVRGLPTKSLTLREIAELAMDFDGDYPPVFAHGRNAITDQAPGFSAQLAEVEVDRETGEVKLHKLVILQDVGRIINPLAIQGQMMGGATQGVGWALYEGMVYDEQGQLLTASWMDYALPDITQAAPQMETVMIEVPSEHGPFGARGVGEPPVVPTAAAICNAIADATGVRLSDLPMTAPRVLTELSNGHGRA